MPFFSIFSSLLHAANPLPVDIDPDVIFSAEASPDGKKVLVGIFRRTSDFTGGTSQFLIISNVTKETLWSTPKDMHYMEGRWSPDGNLVSLVKENQDNTVTLEITEANQYKPVEICSYVDMKNHNWAPNGQKIAFLSGNDQDPEFLKQKAQNQPSYDINNVTIASEVYSNLIPTRLYVVDVDLQKEKSVQPYLLTPIAMSLNSYTAKIPYSWSPDSQQIIFAFIPIDSQQRDEDRRLAIVDVETKHIQSLENLGTAGDPSFSPDGRMIAFIAPIKSPFQNPLEHSDLLIVNSAVHLLELTSKKVTSLGQTPNGRPNIIGWNGNGSEIFVEDALKTTQALYKVPINGQAPTLLSLGSIRNFGDARLNFKRTYIALIGQNLEHPPEVYLSSLQDLNLSQLTNIHKDLPIFSNIQSEIITWKSFDGKEIEGILIYPKGYMKGKKIPLLAHIHGGPTSNWTEDYLGFQSGGLPSFASLSQAGFGILAPNIRGSNGYGAPFRKSIYKNWGPDPFEDVMTGIDSLIKKGIVDPEKLAIAGVSYGGYMAAWAITQTNRFKASIVNAGQVNLISYACLGQTASLSEAFFGGPFWKDYDAWLQNSPIMHVEKINTPTLIQHGQKDSIVIPDQATELFHALKFRNIPVQLSLYFNQGHGLFGNAGRAGSEEALVWLDYYVNPFQKKRPQAIE